VDVPSWLTPSEPSAALRATWGVLKDVLLTFGGLAIVLSEAFLIRPVNDLIVGTGLTMATAGAAWHAATVVSGFTGGSSPPPPSPPGGSGSEPSGEPR
jgi:hypothetical protein